MLHRLRLSDGSRWLWIDSVCINQEDEAEKAAQIDRMATIYQNAWGTIIWLGEEDKTTASAFSMLHTLLEVHLLCTQGFEMGYAGRSKLTFEELRENGLPSKDDQRWKHLSSLLHRPWFTRTWILQEVTLAKNPYVQCGSHVFSWHDISWIVYVLKLGNVDGHYDLDINRAFQIRNFYALHSNPDGASLLQLLYLAHATNAKEYNDQIFAVVGLARDQDLIRPQLEYNKDLVIQNYTATALHYLLAGHLEVLNYASDPSLRDLQQLPSWVPDWSTDAPPIGLLGFVSSDEPYGTKSHSQPKTLPKCRHNPMRLCVQGIVYDKVRAIGLHTSTPLARGSLDSRMRYKLLLLEQWRHLSSRLALYPTGEAIHEAFASTLVLGRDIVEAEKGHAGLYAWHARDLGVQLHAYESNESYSRDELEEYRRNMDFSVYTQTFFLTDKGYMGIGPYFLRPGDRVACFEGGATPFIIRKPKTAYYELVGGAYIRGLMDFEIDLKRCSIIELV